MADFGSKRWIFIDVDRSPSTVFDVVFIISISMARDAEMTWCRMRERFKCRRGRKRRGVEVVVR